MHTGTPNYKAMFFNLIERNREGLMILDSDGVIVFSNTAANNLFDKTGVSMCGKSFGIPLQLEEDAEMELIQDNLTIKHIRVLASEIEWKNLPAFLIMLQDVTIYHQKEQEIRTIAYTDTLTNLPNRLSFLEQLSQSVIHSKEQQTSFALCYIDLDRFKRINDTLGHNIGDELIKLVSNRLQLALDPNFDFYRLGGDEFAILMYDIKNHHEVQPTFTKIDQHLSTPFELCHQEIYVSISAGISIFPQDANNADELLLKADTAMYSAKQQRINNSLHFYASSLGDLTRKQFELDMSLKTALNKNEFVLYYQPQIKMASGELIGFETLIRWQHPTKGIVPPNDFIPLLEETGLICEVGRWVIRQTLQQIIDWKEQGFNTVPIAINVSAVQLEQANFQQQVIDDLREFNLTASDIVLELTESAVMANEHSAVNILNILDQEGIQLHMDDFGTGMSSLSLIRKLPFSCLKVDRTFISNMLSNKVDEALTIATINMAQGLDKQVLAEGIEQIAQHNRLVALGCTLGQGYLYGKPVDAQEVINRGWLKNYNFSQYLHSAQV